MSKTKKQKANSDASVYTRNINLLEDDPLEEIFALNLGDFFTEQLINPELVEKISKKAKEKDKRERKENKRKKEKRNKWRRKVWSRHWNSYRYDKKKS